MNTEKLKEVIKFFKIEGIMEYGDGNMKVALSLLLDLAERYLACEAVMPKKREVKQCKNHPENCDCMECESLQYFSELYNKAIDNCQLALTKKLEGLEEAIDNNKYIRHLYYSCPRDTDLTEKCSCSTQNKIKGLSTAIREYLIK